MKIAGTIRNQTSEIGNLKLCCHQIAKFKFPILILTFSILLLYHFSFQLIGQIYFHQAIKLIHQKNHHQAINYLKKAAHYQPNDPEIKKELGNAYFKLGSPSSNPRNVSFLMQRSKDFFLESFRLNLLDAETAYGLAMVEARLESAYLYFYPEKTDSPYHPLSYFQEAIRLRPNGITYHYALAQYLFSKRKENQLLTTISQLVRIYPLVYFYLKRENFWSSSVRGACQKGLEKAIKEENSVREVHFILSSIMAEDKNWVDAISHYQKGLKQKSYQNRSGNYIRLGSLFLKNRQPDEANICFLYAMEISETRENDLKRLYAIYKNEGYSEKFPLFYQKVSRRFILSRSMEILKARSLMDMKEYQEAKQVLDDMNREYSSAEAYYWLARIAEIEKDWNAMELAIQRATVLDPENRHYHRIFASVLARLKKFERAKKEAELAKN